MARDIASARWQREDLAFCADWDVVSLFEVADPERGITYGIVQPGPMTPGGVPIVRVNNVKGGRIDAGDVHYVSREIAAKYERTRLRGGEVLLTLVGTVGETAIVPPEMAGWNTARAVAVIPVKPEIGPEWVDLCLRSAPLQHLIDVWCTTTVQKTFNLKEVWELPIPLPPPEQRSAIARVLGGLDDKIELNRRMNRTLEDLARGVFRSWFVDFDPVLRRAGAAGTARGVTPHTPHTPPPLHWPARLVDPPAGSALGPIPEGWRVSTIGEEVTVVGGSTPSTDEPKFWEGGTHCWVTPRDLSRLSDPVVIDSERRITDAGLTQISSGLMPRGTVLLSSRAPIGYLAIADVPVAVNQGFIGMKCDKGLPGVFVLRWCEENMEEVLSRAGGTTFAEISKAAFRPIPMIVPPASVVQAFAQAAQGWHDQIVANVRQSRQLAALRDALLPQLLSGEIRLREAERAVGESLHATGTPRRGDWVTLPRTGKAAGSTKGKA